MGRVGQGRRRSASGREFRGSLEGGLLVFRSYLSARFISSKAPSKHVVPWRLTCITSLPLRSVHIDVPRSEISTEDKAERDEVVFDAAVEDHSQALHCPWVV